jgi:hypothetical protein
MLNLIVFLKSIAGLLSILPPDFVVFKLILRGQYKQYISLLDTGHRRINSPPILYDL